MVFLLLPNTGSEVQVGDYELGSREDGEVTSQGAVTKPEPVRSPALSPEGSHVTGHTVHSSLSAFPACLVAPAPGSYLGNVLAAVQVTAGQQYVRRLEVAMQDAMLVQELKRSVQDGV